MRWFVSARTSSGVTWPGSGFLPPSQRDSWRQRATAVADGQLQGDASRDDALLGWLADLARQRGMLPGLSEIARAGGARGSNEGLAALRRLETAGMLRLWVLSDRGDGLPESYAVVLAGGGELRSRKFPKTRVLAEVGA